MEQYAGIAVSLEFSSICVVEARGKIYRELKVSSERDASVQFFKQLEPVPAKTMTGGFLASDLNDVGIKAAAMRLTHDSLAF